MNPLKMKTFRIRIGLLFALFAMALSNQVFPLQMANGNLRTYGTPAQLVTECGGFALTALQDFYFADASWSPMFPTTSDKWVVTRNNPDSMSFTTTNRKNVWVSNFIQVDAAGILMSNEMIIRPGTLAHYVVWDLFLNRDMFFNCPARLEKPDGVVTNFAITPLSPIPNGISVRKLSVDTALGKVNFTVNSKLSNTWKLRSTFHQASWRQLEQVTFDLIYNVSPGIESNGLVDAPTVFISVEPTAAGLALISSNLLQKPAKTLLDTAKRYGISTSGMPASPAAAQTTYLMNRLMSTFSNTYENRVNRTMGVIIPQPVTQWISTNTNLSNGGMYHWFQTNVAISCALSNRGAYDIFSNDLALWGIGSYRVDPSPTLSTICFGTADEPFMAAAGSNLAFPISATNPGPEGYGLAVTNMGALRIAVTGSDYPGLIYGVQSLRQLLKRSADGTNTAVRMTRVIDKPALPLRAFYLEGGPSLPVADVKRLIRDVYSQYKANALMFNIYWTDYKWTSPYGSPVGSNGKPLSELSEIADYARQMGISLIPAVFTLGKVTSLFKFYPSIDEDPTSTDNNTYCPLLPLSHDIVFDIMGEIIAATGCKQMNISHDECKGIGVAACPRCAGRDPAVLFADDVNAISSWLAARGVSAFMWGDHLLDNVYWSTQGVSSASSSWVGTSYTAVTHPAIRLIDSSRVTILDWHYGATNAYPTIRHFITNGFRVAGGTWHSTDNNQNMVAEIVLQGGRGIVATDWGLQVVGPGAFSIAGICAAWNPAAPSPSNAGWDPQALLAASLNGDPKPSHAKLPKVQQVPVDLTPSANAFFSANTMWDFGGGCDLALLPKGRFKSFEVTYQVGDGCVVVGDPLTGNNRVSNRSIFLNTTAKSIVFLQVSGSELAPLVGTGALGWYRVKYAGGQQVMIPLTPQNHTHWLTSFARVNPWANGSGGAMDYRFSSKATLAWEGATSGGDPVALSSLEWVNPDPSNVITEVEIIANSAISGTLLGLAALTLVK